MSTEALPNVPPATARTGALAWLGAEWGLPGSSAAFYQHAVRRSVARALFFFALLAGVVTALKLIGLILGLIQVGIGLGAGFESGALPVITIENGIASTSEHQPYVFIDDGENLVVIDVTGRFTGIDTGRYTQGILMTRTRLLVLNRQGRLQRNQLSDLHQLFNRDPLVIDSAFAQQTWAVIAIVVLVFMLLVFLGWYLLGRLLYLLLLALPMWGLASLLRPGTDYGKILITGVYALLPALVGHYLISYEFGFPGLFTLLFLLAWGLGLYFALRPGPPRPLRAWRALLALPLLLYLGLDLVFGWQVWWLGWPLALLTVGALAVAGLWPRLAAQPEPALTA